MSEQDADFVILEHTADVGVRAWGPTLEAAFEQATHGLLDITGAWRPGPGARQEIAVTGRDLGAVLVDWLGEVLYLQDSLDVVVCGLAVERAGSERAEGWIEVADRPDVIEGTAVKAITYHQLSVERRGEHWETVVYLDI